MTDKPTYTDHYGERPMADVRDYAPNPETMLGFIARRGVVSTTEIACRFAWDMRTARRELRREWRFGRLTCERGPENVNLWQIA
jgi:hypothetical protein